MEWESPAKLPQQATTKPTRARPQADSSYALTLSRNSRSTPVLPYLHTHTLSFPRTPSVLSPQLPLSHATSPRPWRPLQPHLEVRFLTSSSRFQLSPATFGESKAPSSIRRNSQDHSRQPNTSSGHFSIYRVCPDPTKCPTRSTDPTPLSPRNYINPDLVAFIGLHLDDQPYTFRSVSIKSWAIFQYFPLSH
ncbi:hypothetical protein CRG98_045015 [Punica granatum]|uniref:Uncharacterized protein n=1 Tax=Punica granatum TaxID=22663 RepID=A0A2I0HSD6_PUNGR|nr:hypothetical protein CRG98_045015 [Punica granatum]